jgi:hypothetical protein
MKNIEEYITVGFPNAVVYGQNGIVADENCYQYEFRNMGNCPVTVNGVFLDRYFSGIVTAPTVIGGNGNTWVPQMKSGERDTTSYSFQFHPTFYPGTNPVQLVQSLVVIKKLYVPLPNNRKNR